MHFDKFFVKVHLVRCRLAFWTATAQNVADMGLAENIRAKMHEKGWTQQRLEEEAGLTKSYLSRILGEGRNPTAPKLLAIAQALGVDEGELLGQTLERTETDASIPRVTPNDPCPKRTRAAEVALEDGISPMAIARVMAMPADSRRSIIAWLVDMARGDGRRL